MGAEKNRKIEEQGKLDEKLLEIITKQPIEHLEIEKLLRNRANVNKRDLDGRTAIFYAAQQGNSAVIKILLDAKAWVNPTLPEEECAFDIFIEEPNAELVQKLLELKATISNKDENEVQFHFRADKRNADIITQIERLAEKFKCRMQITKLIEPPISAAVYKQDAKSVELLLAAKATLKQQDGDYNELVLAAEAGNLNITKMLIAANAALDARDLSGCTALMVASRAGHLEVMEVLLEAGANPYKMTRGAMALSFAHNGRESVISLFEKFLENRKGLWEAVRVGNMMAVQKILDSKVSVNSVDPDGNSVLCTLAQHGVKELQNGIPSMKSGEIVKVLVDKKADVNKPNVHMRIPLYYAIDRLDCVMAEALLKIKSNVIVEDYGGRKVNACELVLSRFGNPDGAPEVQQMLNLLESRPRKNKQLALCAGLFGRLAGHPQNPLAHVSRQSLFDANVLRLPLKLAGYAPVPGESRPEALGTATAGEDGADITLARGL